MVKFGKRLQEDQYSEWSEHYIRYKELKKALYVERDEGEKSEGLFLQTLEREIAKVRKSFAPSSCIFLFLV